jgi:hypothetical protein
VNHDKAQPGGLSNRLNETQLHKQPGETRLDGTLDQLNSGLHAPIDSKVAGEQEIHRAVNRTHPRPTEEEDSRDESRPNCPLDVGTDGPRVGGNGRCGS